MLPTIPAVCKNPHVIRGGVRIETAAGFATLRFAMRARQLTILLVEDDTNDVVLLERALRRSGLSFDLHVVADGRDAIHYLAHTGEYSNRRRFPDPSVLLLDLDLPWRNGFSVLEWVRQSARFHSLPVVIVSSYDSNQTLKLAEELAPAVSLSSAIQVPKTSRFTKLIDRLRRLSTESKRALPASGVAPHETQTTD
jgi:CheY-like chemotaxis protein